MSKGPGRIERAIRELFDAHPDLAFVTDELAEHCYPGVRVIERKHQVSVLRAAQKVVALDPDWDAWRADSQGGTWIFLNRANVQSYALARMMREGRTLSFREAGEAVRRWILLGKLRPSYRHPRQATRETAAWLRQ